MGAFGWMGSHAVPILQRVLRGREVSVAVKGAVGTDGEARCPRFGQVSLRGARSRPVDFLKSVSAELLGLNVLGIDRFGRKRTIFLTGKDSLKGGLKEWRPLYATLEGWCT